MSDLRGAEITIDPVSLRAMPVDPAAMAACAQSLRAQAEQQPDPTEAARLASQAAMLLTLLGQHEQARELAHFALARQPARERLQDRTVTELRLAQVHQFAGDLATAESLLATLVARCRDEPGIARLLDVALQHLGKVLFDQGQYDQALAFFQEALALRKAGNDPELVASTQLAIAEVTRRLGLARQSTP